MLIDIHMTLVCISLKLTFFSYSIMSEKYHQYIGPQWRRKKNLNIKCLCNRPFASSKIRTQSNCVLNVDDKFYQYNFNNNVELSNFPYFPNRT